MSVPEPQQEHEHEQHSHSIPRRRAPLWALVLAIVVPFAIIAGVLWFVKVVKPGEEDRAFNHEVMLRPSGLSRPTSNKLDARFTDADNDMVADPPTDPKDFVDPPKL